MRKAIVCGEEINVFWEHESVEWWEITITPNNVKWTLMAGTITGIDWKNNQVEIMPMGTYNHRYVGTYVYVSIDGLKPVDVEVTGENRIFY